MVYNGQRYDSVAGNGLQTVVADFLPLPPAFTPGCSPVILLHTFLNVKLVNLSSRNTGRDYVLLIQFFVLFTSINVAAKSVTNLLIIPHVINRFNLFGFTF